MLKRRTSFALVVLLALIIIVIVRTSRPLPHGVPVAPLARVSVDGAGALERFAGAIRIPTVSQPLEPPDAPAMQLFREYLQRSFPLVHASMRRELVGPGGVLFTWAGTDSSLAPILMLAHMDVVPVDPDSLAQWTHPPFAAERAGGFVWGRGTMDDKQAICSLLEASEALLKEGYRPHRTILFAFGDDEENDGHAAAAIAALLLSRGVHAQFVMDEGGQIARGTLPGVRGDAALIGVAEKGIVSLQLTVKASTGHSSRPPTHTAVGILSRAVTRLEEHQMPASIGGVAGQMLEAVSLDMTLSERVMVRNRWLFGPLLLRSLGQTPSGNAVIRTTTAVTMFQGGIKDNILPGKATAVVNFRILPGDTVDSIKRHVHDVVADDRVVVSLYGDLAADPSSVAPTDVPQYVALEQTVHEFFSEAVVAPNLLVARTDSAQYGSIAQNVYKFFPATRDEADAERVHGVNERLGEQDYLRSIQFMATLLRREAQ